MTKIASLWIAVALLLAGCAPAMSNAAASPRDDAAVAAVQTALLDAMSVGKEYGRQHLGHYLELNRKELAKGGLSVPDGVVVEVFIDHYDLCIAAESSELPPTHEWYTGTVTSDSGEPVAGGTCAADALKRVEVKG